MRLWDRSTVRLTILLSINNEEYVGQSIRGAYHTTVCEKVSKLTAFFFIFFSLFLQIRGGQFLIDNLLGFFCFYLNQIEL